MLFRSLGIDYGDARIGLALSDPTETLASALDPLEVRSMRKSIDEITALAKQKDAEMFVVGLPLNMNGSEGPQAGKVRAFANNLQKVSALPVVMKDERLTTVMVTRAFDQTGVKKSKRLSLVDSASAQVILQNYLDGKKRQVADEPK